MKKVYKSFDEIPDNEIGDFLAEIYTRIDDGKCIMCEHSPANITNNACIRCCQND